MPATKRRSQKIEVEDEECDLLGDPKPCQTQSSCQLQPLLTNIADMVAANKQSLDMLIESNRILLACIETNDIKLSLLTTEMSNLYSKVDSEVRGISMELNTKMGQLKSDEIPPIMAKLETIKTHQSKEFLVSKEGIENNLAMLEDQLTVYSFLSESKNVVVSLFSWYMLSRIYLLIHIHNIM